MADIELVIKINDTIMHKFYNGTLDREEACEELYSALVDAISLPKGHGQLKDADELINLIHSYAEETEEKEDHLLDVFVTKLLNDSPTIIPADKESEE